MRQLTLLFLILTFLFCFPLAGQTEPDSSLLSSARASIDAGNNEWIKGFETGDPARVAAIFADNGMMFGSNGRVFKGKEALHQRIKQIMDYLGTDIKVTVSTLQVWVDGDTAYETGEYKYLYTKDGSQVTDEGTYCTMWHRQDDGKWKLVLDIPVK